MKFKYQNISDIVHMLDVLGQGSFGVVYRGKVVDYSCTTRWELNDQEIAIKSIELTDQNIHEHERELDFMQNLKCPYIVNFLDCYIFRNRLWIMMELCEGGSLADILILEQNIKHEGFLKAVMAYCILGLDHIHNHRSLHRDIKAGNILLCKDGKIKLGDFGVSARLTDSMAMRMTVIGTPYWMAPEILQETGYDGRADIWSLGITLLELCHGSPPYFNVNPLRAIFMISSKPAPKLRDESSWSSEMVDFISKCLVKEKSNRFTARELLDHPWIKREVESAILEHKVRRRGLSVLRQYFETHIDEIMAQRKAVGELSCELTNSILKNSTVASDFDASKSWGQTLSEATLKYSHSVTCPDDSSIIDEDCQDFGGITSIHDKRELSKSASLSVIDCERNEIPIVSLELSKSVPDFKKAQDFVDSSVDHHCSTDQTMIFEDSIDLSLSLQSCDSVIRTDEKIRKSNGINSHMGNDFNSLDENDLNSNDLIRVQDTFTSPKNKRSNRYNSYLNSSHSPSYRSQMNITVEKNLNSALKYFRDENVLCTPSNETNHNLPLTENNLELNDFDRLLFPKYDNDAIKYDDESMTSSHNQRDDHDLLNLSFHSNLRQLQTECETKLFKLEMEFQARKKLLEDQFII